MSKQDSLKYTKDHEWIDAAQNEAVVGITDYAAEQLGDVVHVELPKVGQTVTKGASIGVVESVKSVSDIYSPISGVVAAINEALTGQPELINQAPYEAGWIVKIRPASAGESNELLTHAQYQAFLSEEV